MNVLTAHWMIEAIEVPCIPVGQKGWLIARYYDPALMEAPDVNHVDIWVTEHQGTLFNWNSLTAGLDLKCEKPAVNLIVDLAGANAEFPTRCAPGEQRDLGNHLWVTLESAVLAAATSTLLLGFSPLAQLLLQSAMRGHTGRMRWVPDAGRSDRPLDQEGEETFGRPDQQWCGPHPVL